MTGHIIHIKKGVSLSKDGKLVIKKYYPTIAAKASAKKKQTWRAHK